MKQWWAGLAQRERWFLGGALALSLLLCAYVLLWEPWWAQYQRLQQAVHKQRADLAWMRQAVLALPSSGAAPKVQRDNRSLLARVDASMRAAGLASALKNTQPQGNNQLSARLESVEFEQLLTWLSQLEAQNALRLSQVSVERSANAGRVNVRLVLEDSAP